MGIAMGHNGMKYPLASRELVADSIEAVANGHAFDGLVLIPNCDKIVPGMLMAAARLNIPAIVVSGGPMLPGRLNGTDISVSTVFEAAGRFEAGKIDKTELSIIEHAACPGCGSCSGLFTANTMNALLKYWLWAYPVTVLYQQLTRVPVSLLPNVQVLKSWTLLLKTCVRVIL